jgi:hypothetical protein
MPKPSFRAAAAALAGILIGIGGCTESPSAPAAPAPYKLLQVANAPSFDATGSAGALIGTNGGTITTPGGTTLAFPAGAVSQQTYVTVSPAQGLVGVEIEPHGLTFPAGKEPTLTLSYGRADVTGLSALTVVYVDGGAIEEVLSTSVSPQARTLTAKLPHFSIYAGAGY